MSESSSKLEWKAFGPTLTWHHIIASQKLELI